MRVCRLDSHPERATLIAWAFERYATGETSVTALLRDLTARGLLSVPSPKVTLTPIHAAEPPLA